MLNSLRLAISFLTIVPIYKKVATNEDLARAVSYYPLVGLMLGASAAGICFILRSIGFSLAGDTMALVTLILLTGGLHLDGLMDTADGIFSGRSLERKLEIMKDSRVGAMGVIAFGTVMLLKISLLYELELGLKLTALILAPVAGRWAMVYAIIRYPYARATGGLGLCFKQAGKPQVFVASLILVAATVWLAGLKGLAVVGMVILGAMGITAYISERIGGMTGDTYGATGELIETWTLFTILLGQQIGLL